MNKILLSVLIFIFISCTSNKDTIPNQNPKSMYKFPEESSEHEGTWLQWPHHYQYGITYRNRLDDTWIAMAKEIVAVEKLHLIIYDQIEKERVIKLLENNNLELTNIDFRIYPTDDVWVRDNGPIFVKDTNGKLLIEDWGFNGWGNKAAFSNCDGIPNIVAKDLKLPIIDLNKILINEGGAIEMDGNGTLLATKSAILNKNRNPNLSQKNIEDIFTKYLDVSNFIWLEGKAGLEITDMHIDGFARFGNANTIVTMSESDLIEWQLPQSDIPILYAAKKKNGSPYTFLKLPLTKDDVTTAYGKKLGFKGSYINYYILNKKVLVPNYNDANDKVANDLLQALYPDRKVVGIDVRNLYENGGMIHCVTQQQPL